MTAYSIAYGKEEEHATALKLGLSLLPSNFVAEVCGVCKGEGAYRQLFNLGCGGGMHKGTIYLTPSPFSTRFW